MPNRKRKVVLHRIAKTETRVYNQPVREVVRDIQVVFEPQKYNWLTQPIQHPRWFWLVVVATVFGLEFLR
jgi:hypothetical protein